MAKQPFFPRDFEAQILWLLNFANKLPLFAAKYDITPVQLTDVQTAKTWMVYWWELNNQLKIYAQGVTAFKNEVAYGAPAGSLPSVPVLAPVPVPPPAFAPGVFVFMLSIANAIKVHKDYTIADGEQMGLEGAEITPPDLANARPVLKATIATDQVDVGWKKQGLPVDAIELWVKRGAADYVFLAVDTTTPKYTDTHPLPATEEKWTYKGVYIIADGRIGLWSEEVSVTVKV